MNNPNLDLDYLDSQDVGGSGGIGLLEPTGPIDPLDGLEFERAANVNRPLAIPANNRGGRRDLPLYVDIETVPDEERMHLFGLPPLPEVPPETTSANCPPATDLIGPLTVSQLEERLALLNPDAAYLELLMIEERKGKNRKGILDACKAQGADRAKLLNAEAVRRKEMSTTPEMCRIVAVGWARGDEKPRSSVIDTPDPQVAEKQILEALWILIRETNPIVTCNGIGFDIPVILFRSILLGVEPSRQLNLSPWSNRDILDLQIVRHGTRIPDRGRGLKWTARLMGIQVPAGDITGADAERLLKEDPEKLGQYVRSDVAVTRELHKRMQGYWCD